MILGSKISCWGFPLPQLSGPRATQRCPRYHSPFPALKILRDNNLLKTEHWIFSPHPRQSEPYPPTAPKRLPHAPSPSNLKEMDLPLPFPGLPSHPGPQNRPLTNCLGNWEGLQLVLPIRLGEGWEEGGGPWNCGRVLFCSVQRVLYQHPTSNSAPHFPDRARFGVPDTLSG